jgi:hypothetical protein
MESFSEATDLMEEEEYYEHANTDEREDSDDAAWDTHYKRYMLGKLIQGPVSRSRLMELYDYYLASHKPAPEPQQVLDFWLENMKKSRNVVPYATKRSRVAIESLLDDDILIYVMTFLQVRDLLSLAQTSHKFRTLSSNTWLWKSVYQAKCGKTSGVDDYRALCLNSVFLDLSISRSSFLGKEKAININTTMSLNTSVRTLKTMLCGYVQSGCPSSCQVEISLDPSSNNWIDLDHLPTKATLKSMSFLPGDQRVFVFVSKRREPEPLPQWLQQELMACGFQQPVVSAS